jgi:thiamine biosynthesis lipoprotein ApbE/Na+-translocating ferredoxin:NAD+ oxidoreductase RnfG subunit
MVPRLLSLLVRLWRLAALAAAVLLLQKQASPRPRPAAFALADAQAFFPAAAALAPGPGGVAVVNDAEGRPQGSLLTTSPAADRISGYSGPSNLLVALDPEGRIVGTRILESEDTPAHVDHLRRSSAFSKSLIGWNPAAKPAPKTEGIAGSTLTALAMVEGIAERLGGGHGSLRFPEPVTLEEARSIFPGAADIAPDERRAAWFKVRDLSGAVAGYVVRTAPASDPIIGYAGPSECLLAVAADAQTIREIRLRKSYDTSEYTERIVEERDYLKALAKWKVSEWPGLDFGAEKIEGVAGATMTSAAIAEGIRETFRKNDAQKPDPARGMPPVKDLVLWVFLVGACVMSFTNLRGIRWLRLAWQAALVGGLGIWLGQFVSLGLLAGWAGNGVSGRQIGPLLVLGGLALVVPWAARRQVYCHHVCPHGAAQEWLGRLVPAKMQLHPPARLHRVLRMLPPAVLAFGFFWVLYKPSAALGSLEPFDFWILGTAAVSPFLIALAGLGLSAFVPMAYCRYGCPTGALLAFVRTASAHERFSARDFAAFAVLAAGGALVFAEPDHFEREKHVSGPADTASVRELRGNGFGSTWCVKVRGAAPDPAGLRSQIAAELERIESTLSHWRPESATSRFNRYAGTDYQEVPEELAMLVQFTQQLSRASAGAFDITVSPLVDAWGYGPPGANPDAPSREGVELILQRVGWERLSVGGEGRSLRKAHPGVALDLGSVLQGYAVDRVAALLEQNGCSAYLVEVGGELRAGGAWSVAIENPADPARPLLVMELKDAALATSGLARARRRIAGETVSHIISPLTGRPVTGGLEACSVLMPTCLEADGWATTLVASETEAARAVARREHLRAWVLDGRGNFEAWAAEE